jgi:hypothetical protein
MLNFRFPRSLSDPVAGDDAVPVSREVAKAAKGPCGDGETGATKRVPGST